MAKRQNGIIQRRSNHSVDQTVDRFKNLLAAKAIKLFALVDHSGEAELAGLKMRPTKLLIFGNPKSGTPLMLAAPEIAIDLPLKVLVSEDTESNVWVSYNSTEYLTERHGVPQELLPNIAVVEMLAFKAARVMRKQTINVAWPRRYFGNALGNVQTGVRICAAAGGCLSQ